MIETAISLLGEFNTVNAFYKTVCGVFRKDQNSQHFEQAVAHLGDIKTGIERLSESILYAPHLQVVQDVQQTQQQVIKDLREVREKLEPVQRALGNDILSSAIILTPEKMQQALIKNPWEVLLDVRPLSFFEANKLPPEGVPVTFEFQGTRYMGWQLRGTLPILFNCRYEELWLPDSLPARLPEINTVPKIKRRTGKNAAADLIVAPASQYSTITAALEQAKNGDRIVVKSGVYRENIVLNKSVKLIAEGIPVIESSETCIWMQTEEAVIRGFIVRCLAKPVDQRLAIYIPQGKLIIEQCEVISDSFHCIEVTGQNSQAHIQGCKIHDSQAGAGISIDRATTYIEDCDIFGNAKAGIYISEEGNPIIRNCKIHDGKGSGILVYQKGAGQIEDCDIFGNALAGIAIREESNPIIRNCKIHDGEAFGIWVYQKGAGQIEDCDIFGNTNPGIVILEESNPIIRNCKIYDGKGNGIWVYQKGAGQIENCDIFGNAEAGIAIGEEGNPIIRSCKIHDGKSGGILVSQKGAGQIENCDIFGNPSIGIVIREESNPIIRNCTIKNNSHEAIWAYYSGKGTVENCDLRGNERGAWNIDSTSQVQRSGNKE